MISKEEAKEIYIREELNFLKGDTVDKDLENEAISTLIDNDLFDEATEEFTEVAQEYSTEVITPLCKKLFHILKNKGNLKIGDKVNIEYDVIGKYIQKFTSKKESKITLEFLRENGF